jgi:hypothetical protein
MVQLTFDVEVLYRLLAEAAFGHKLSDRRLQYTADETATGRRDNKRDRITISVSINESMNE